MRGSRLRGTDFCRVIWNTTFDSNNRIALPRSIRNQTVSVMRIYGKCVTTQNRAHSKMQ
ncbi:hypothetical protein D3C81_355680 [compost metagenome]